ncbi:hypothetical protein K469DRAFT_686261 [Zopfia rhizophila CBS 207.26]|uniref:Uncharacterized protein n=1 Tax=Zopfia rhizophila CBS 207.26 TaxID=1314779 RepID=A0A6A6EA86_9PEZI|nr:hypothetical protein K469DRAFT_686261 [Zopfia rhizophila CBS 207.26]
MPNFSGSIYALEGLPKSFRDEGIDIELPSDVDDDFVTLKGYLLSLASEPTGMTMFVSIVKGCRILSNTFERLYRTTDRRKTLTEIASIDLQLGQFAQTLLEHLQFEPSGYNQFTNQLYN